MRPARDRDRELDAAARVPRHCDLRARIALRVQQVGCDLGGARGAVGIVESPLEDREWSDLGAAPRR